MKDLELPTVLLEVDCNVARASGTEPIEWSIYAEQVEFGVPSVEVFIKVATDSGSDPLMTQVAHITVHKNGNDSLIDEVQEVSAALLWSALRSWHMKEEI